MARRHSGQRVIPLRHRVIPLDAHRKDIAPDGVSTLLGNIRRVAAAADESTLALLDAAERDALAATMSRLVAVVGLGTKESKLATLPASSLMFG